MKTFYTCFVVGFLLIAQIRACDKLKCGSVVVGCSLNCVATDECKECFGELWDQCCDCVDICEENKTNLLGNMQCYLYYPPDSGNYICSIQCPVGQAAWCEFCQVGPNSGKPFCVCQNSDPCA